MSSPKVATNREIASALDLLADLMELDGANIYKIIAHRKAAHRVAEANYSIEELSRRGELTQLPDIGDKIAAKVTELVETGQIRELEEFFGRYPPELVEIQNIQGVGPRTARKLWEDLGIASLDELEAAARGGQVAPLPGLGPKAEQNIIHAIERYRARGGRLLLGEALPAATECMELLARLPDTTEVALAGSIRRMKETVKDVDIIASASDPGSLTQAFCHSPLAEEVIATGPTKCSIRTFTGTQVDLRVVPARLFGNLLQHFTGSREHNVALRELALSRGLKVSEYGVEETGSGTVHQCPTESDVYKLLGLDYIPPELRENNGELEAAMAGELPRLVEATDIKGDLHVHSTWSDGHAGIREMAGAARERGYQYIAISDHSQSLAVAGGLTPERLKEQLDEIGTLNAEMDDFHVFTSMEVDVKADGSLDLPDDDLAALDFVTVSIHSGFTQSREQIMTRLAAAMEKSFVRAIGHPTGRLINRRDPYEVDIEALIDGAARSGTVLEINAHYQRLDLCDLHARMAQEAGATLVINSDAHSPGDLGLLKYGVATARRGWIEPHTVLNTIPVDRLTALLKQPKSRLIKN